MLDGRFSNNLKNSKKIEKNEVVMMTKKKIIDSTKKFKFR